jgi:hypothetical protein
MQVQYMQFCNICVQCLLLQSVYKSVIITNSQPHVRAIIVFMCVKDVCACNKLHHGKVLLAVMTSPSYLVTASLIGYLNMTHFIHHSTLGKLSCIWHLLLAWLAMASYVRIACGDNSAQGWGLRARNHKWLDQSQLSLQLGRRHFPVPQCNYLYAWRNYMYVPFALIQALAVSPR